MKRHIHTLRQFIIAHKIISVIAALVIIFGGYKIISAYTGGAGQTTYIASTAIRGTIITSVSGSGQVSGSNEVDLKSKASGNVVVIGVTSGQEVTAGTLIAQLDARSAEIELQSARIAYQKLTQPADAVTTLQTESALANATENLTNDYSTALSAVAGAFVDMPSIIDGMKSALYGTNGFLTDQNIGSVGTDLKAYRDQAGINFDIAQRQYETTLAKYKTISATSASSTIADIAEQTAGTVRALALAVKDAKNTADAIQSASYTISGIATFQTNVNSWTSKINSNLASLTSANSAIANDMVSVTEKTAALKKLRDGADALDIASQALSLKQKQYAYDDAFIRAPFDGVIAKVSVKKTDAVSSGASVATLITKQKTATISLNEVDVAKIKVGNKATLTFDAIDRLTISGSIAEIDGVGTVSQGVVTYSVKIAFDTQDDRVRSGMSVSATIITDAKPDVLTVPNAAVKSSGGSSYVEIFTASTTAPTERTVEIGASNDSLTEITSGLKEGEQVVTRTVTSSAATTQAPNILSAVGARGGAGGRTGGTGR